MINPLPIKLIVVSAFVLSALSLGTGPSLAAGSHGGGHGKEAKESGHMQGGLMKDNHMKGGHMKGGHGHGFDFGEPGKASEVSRTVEIVMKENFYEPEEIDVKAGETIRFNITNKGELVHEFNLGTGAMHAVHQKEMMMMVEHGVLEADKINYHMMKMDMGGGKTMEHDDPNSVLLEPGKSGEIIWKFTKAAGLEFACNVPGHYDAGMMGNIHFK
jgi:uncharacterized cupredoxin-like copper-binding protein